MYIHTCVHMIFFLLQLFKKKCAAIVLNRPSDERCVGDVVVQDKIRVLEREDCEVGSVEEHGSTATLWVHPHHRDTRVVQQPSLQQWERIEVKINNQYHGREANMQTIN